MISKDSQVLIRLFSSHTRVKLVSFFITYPKRAFFVREITRRINERINSVRRELKNLEDIGFLTSFPEMNRLYYKVNPDFIIFNELKSIVQKTTDIKDSLEEKFRKLGDVVFVVLTGYLTGTKNSPTDILIVGENIDRLKVEKLVEEMSQETSEILRYTILSVNDFLLRDSLGDRFLSSIISTDEKIIVLDDRHKFRPTKNRPKIG